MELEFTFDELPLHSELGFDAALINGTATISYHREGEWSVRAIALDGHRRRSLSEVADRFAPGPASMYERKSVDLCKDAYAWMYSAIVDRLENGPWADSIRSAVDDALAADGVKRSRSDRDEHSTYRGQP